MPRVPNSREYTLHLGVALQLTNIIRDVKGRPRARAVYLPLETWGPKDARSRTLPPVG